MKITIIDFSDSRNIYIVNNVRHYHTYDDSQMLDQCADRYIESIDRIYITAIDDKNPEPWEALEYCDTVERLREHLDQYPYIVEGGWKNE